MESGIYSITCKTTEKLYIGCASYIRKRFGNHKDELRANRHGNNYLQKAWNKYGENDFKFERIEICEKDELFIREHYWCMLLKVHDKKIGYNIEPTDPNRKHGRSEETKRKISISHKGRKKSPEAIKKVADALRGRKQSLEQRQRQSERSKGKSRPMFSDKWKENIKIGHSKNPVIQLNKNGEFIKDWISASEAGRSLGIAFHAIYKVCNYCKNYNTAGGFKWRYKDEDKYKEKELRKIQPRVKFTEEEKRQKQREYRNSHKAHTREYRENNRDRIKEWSKEWRNANPEKVKQNHRNYYKRKVLKLNGKVHVKEIIEL